MRFQGRGRMAARLDSLTARWAGRRPTALGLLGALLLMAGAAGYLAMVGPPYIQDESSHVGYTLSLRDGTLPSLDTRVPTEGGGPELEAALGRPSPYSSRDVHAANNPPFPYILSMPLAELTDRAGVDGGALLGVRFLNVAGAVAAVGCAYLLGRELGGGDDFVGLVTAGLIAGLISISVVSSVAGLDGPALAATTGTTWALARFARSRSLPDATHLGVWCAVAAGVRPMALAFALVAGVLGLLLALTRSGWRSLPRFAVRLALPTILFAGWFLVLNITRYGDPTGSSELFDKLGLEHRRGTIDLLWGPDTFLQPLPYLLTMIYGAAPVWFLTRGVREYAITALVLIVVSAAVGLSVRSARATTAARAVRVPDLGPDIDRADEPALVPAAWISMVVLGAVPMLLIAQHMSGGGNANARYLLPTVPIIAAAVALVTSKISRWLSVIMVAGFALAHVLRVRRAGELPLGNHMIFREILRGPLVGPVRGVGLVIAAGGAVLLLASLIVMAARPSSAEVEPVDETAERDPEPVSA